MGKTIGGVAALYTLYNKQKAQTDTENKLNVIGESLTFANMLGASRGGDLFTDGSIGNGKDFWTPILIGTAASYIGPKIPIISQMPKNIPIVGKMLRW